MIFVRQTRKRVEKYWRTFIYDRANDLVIVFDNITATKASYTKRSIFHTINRPYKNNNKIISRTYSKTSPNQQGGTLEATVLFPKNSYINILGGIGAEFFVRNKNYDAKGKIKQLVKKRKKNPPEPGSWRVEIIPPYPQKNDNFLTIYNPTILGENKEINIEALETKTHIGCKTRGYHENYNLLFSKIDHSLMIKFNNNSKSKEQFELMKKNSILTKDSKNSFYIYKISTKDHEQVGIVGTAKLSAYDNLHIRGHEEIYLERAQKRLKQMDNLNAQVGPIYVIHPDNAELNEIIKKEIVSKPIYSFEALDHCKHEMWVINEESKILKICDLFNKINRIYIADGHHRIEALSKFAEIKKHQNHLVVDFLKF